MPRHPLPRPIAPRELRAGALLARTAVRHRTAGRHQLAAGAAPAQEAARPSHPIRGGGLRRGQRHRHLRAGLRRTARQGARPAAGGGQQAGRQRHPRQRRGGQARPDGYTLLFTYAASIVINATLQPALPYDAQKDLVPVAQVGSGGNLLVVSPDLPVHDIRELAAYVRAQPQGLDYASWGIGSGGHLTMESLKAQTGLKLRHVPYKTVSQILTDMQGGIVKLAFVDASSPLPLIRAGKLRPIAVSGTRRVPAFPRWPP